MTEENTVSTVVRYNFTETGLAKLKEEGMALKVNGPDDVENYTIVKEAHQKVRDLRIAIDPERKRLNANSLKEIQDNNAEAKRVEGKVREVEDYLLSQRKIVEDEKKHKQEEKARKVQEEKDRIKKEEDDKIEAERKVEEARLEAVRLKQEAIAKTQKEAQDKIDEQTRKNEAEAQRLVDEEARIKRETEEAAIVKWKAEQYELDRIEREKRLAEDIEKAKGEAVRQEIIRREEEEAEKVRLRQEEEKKVEHERQMAPDKEKLQLLRETLAGIKFPEVQSPEAKGILMAVKESIESLRESLLNAKL